LLLAKTKSGKGAGGTTKSTAARRSANGGGGGAGFGGGSTTTTTTKPSTDPLDKVNLHGSTPPLPGIVVEAVGPGNKTARGINKWKTRSAQDDDGDEDHKRMRTRAKEEEGDPSKSGSMADQPTEKKRLVQISTHPLIFTVDDFIDPVLCERIGNDGGGCFDLMFPERVADLLFDGQESELDGLLFNTDSSQNHNDINSGLFPHGVHMDTNGQVLFRHVTCILYLNTVPIECGGATVFPLARCCHDDDVALAGSRVLLAEKISHTRSPAVATVPGAAAAARAIESRVRDDDSSARRDYDPNADAVATALHIQPQAGRLLVFFSRDEHGAEDPRAWHAGERLRSSSSSSPSKVVVVEKRILTLFKQVDYGTVNNLPHRAQTTFEEYLAPQIQRQQQSLKVKAQLGLPIEYGGGTTEATTTAATSA
jgi:hypothetical protein